jgi:hypothetical protein
MTGSRLAICREVLPHDFRRALLARVGIEFFGTTTMMTKIERVKTHTPFTHEEETLYIPSKSPTLDGFIFAKRLSPYNRMNPRGHWKTIARGTTVDTLPGEVANRPRRSFR